MCLCCTHIYLACSFSTQDTRPDVHTSWTDHIQLVDGHWAPDGTSLVVSDVAGQWHAYSLGAPDLVKHARYDQFLESDYDRLTRDVNNAVIDDNTQQPPHLRPTRCFLCRLASGAYCPLAYLQILTTYQQHGKVSLIAITAWETLRDRFSVSCDNA